MKIFHNSLVSVLKRILILLNKLKLVTKLWNICSEETQTVVLQMLLIKLFIAQTVLTCCSCGNNPCNARSMNIEGWWNTPPPTHTHTPPIRYNISDEVSNSTSTYRIFLHCIFRLSLNCFNSLLRNIYFAELSVCASGNNEAGFPTNYTVLIVIWAVIQTLMFRIIKH